MAFFQGSIASKAIGMEVYLGAILPQTVPKHRRVLYLLHGLEDNGTAWWRMTALERIAKEHELTVILPEGHRSFYTDMQYGGGYFTYLTQELPQIVKNLFGILPNQEDTLIAGASMGGYGAIRCALCCPQQYAACGSFSPVESPDNPKIPPLDPIFFRDRPAIGKAEEHGLLQVASQLKNKADIPQILITCGKDDLLLPESEQLAQGLKAQGLPVQYQNWAGGHDWLFWEQSLSLFVQNFSKR